MNDTEETVRHLLAVATEDMPPGIDLLDGVRIRSRARTTRVRVALSAGTAAVLAAAAAITLSAVPAPSALAQVTKAAAATAGQSYQVRSVSNLASEDGSAALSPVTVTGEFDPARGSARRRAAAGPGSGSRAATCTCPCPTRSRPRTRRPRESLFRPGSPGCGFPRRCGRAGR